MTDWTIATERITGFLEQLVLDRRVGGAALLVSVGGEPVFEHYAGEAAPGVLATAETLWPVALISKLYTAAAAMAMIERGMITLNTRVSLVLPGFTGDRRELVTLRHLLTHTSGLPYESEQMLERLAALTSFDGLVDETYQQTLLFPPGTDHCYSDFGYGLAGRLLASIAGVSFPAVVQQFVIKPGSLHETFMPPPEEVYDRTAYVKGGLAADANGAMYNSHYARQLAHPAFGVIASLPDLMRFRQFFTPGASQRIHSVAGVRTMTTDQTWSDEAYRATDTRLSTALPYGAGFAIKSDSWTPDLASPGSYGHGGASGCMAWIDPAYDLAFVFVSNRHYNADPEEFMARLMQVSNLVYAASTTSSF